MSLDEQLCALAASQHGVITRSQAVAVGMSTRMIRTRIRSGRWSEPAPGVHVVAGSVDSFMQRLTVACAATSDAVASHDSAGRLHQFAYLPDERRIHVSVPVGRSTRSPIAVVHSRAHLDPVDIVNVAGIAATTVERTIIDLAATLHPPRLARLLDDALDRHMTSCAALDECFGRHARQGCRGAIALRTILMARGDGLEATESHLERRYLTFCDEFGLERPDLQWRLTWRDKVVGRLDMSYPFAKLIVELDGRRGHRQLTDQERDRVRDQEAAAAGWLTARVTYGQLRTRRDALHDRLDAILRSRVRAA